MSKLAFTFCYLLKVRSRKCAKTFGIANWLPDKFLLSKCGVCGVFFGYMASKVQSVQIREYLPICEIRFSEL